MNLRTPPIPFCLISSHTAVRLWVLCLCFFPLLLVGQNGNLKKGNELYEKMAYASAIKQYEKVLDKTFSGEAMTKLADCYRLTDQYDEAVLWYSRLIYTNYAKPIHYFHYGQVLMNQERYRDAKVWFKQFAEAVPDDPRGMRFYNACDSIRYLRADSAGYEIQLLDLNSEESDFGAIYHKEGIVFASARGGGCRRRRARRRFEGRRCGKAPRRSRPLTSRSTW